MANFSVVTVANQEKIVLDRVADYYLHLGANSVVVSFDGEPAFTMNNRQGRLEFIVCDIDYWQSLGLSRPEVWDERQMGIYRRAISERTEDWLFIVDCDEYLVTDRVISDALDEVPSTIDILRVQNVEAIWGPNDNRHADMGATWFRSVTGSKWKQLVLSKIYGEAYQFMNVGLLGHSSGKHFVRPGREYQVRNPHFSFHLDGTTGPYIWQILRGNTYLCHFDAISFSRWKEKFQHRSKFISSFKIMRDGRYELVDLIAKTTAKNESQQQALFEALYCVSGPRLLLLRLLGLAFRNTFFRDKISPK